MHTHHEKIARAIKYTSFAKKNPNDVNDVNFYLSVGDKIDQARLDAHHAEAKKITGTPTPPVTGAPTKIDGEKPAPVEPRAPVPGEAGYKMEGRAMKPTPLHRMTRPQQSYTLRRRICLLPPPNGDLSKAKSLFAPPRNEFVLVAQHWARPSPVGRSPLASSRRRK